MVPLEVIGWLGNSLFAFCALPQAIKIFRTHDTRALSWGFLLMWGAGEILSLCYVAIKSPNLLPVLANYVFNFTQLVYMIWAKFTYERAN